MGSLVARKYLKTHDDQISALILSGAPWNNPGAQAGLETISSLISCFILPPDMTGLCCERCLSCSDGAFGRKFGGNAWLSANEENVQAFMTTRASFSSNISCRIPGYNVPRTS